MAEVAAPDLVLVPVPAVPAAPAARGDGCQWAGAARLLGQWFDVEFRLFDGLTGEEIGAGQRLEGDWPAWAEMCRQVFDRGRAEIICEDDPLLVLALPISSADGGGCVAAAPFLARRVHEPERLRAIGRRLGWNAETISNWAARQTPVAASVLVRLAGLAIEKLAVDGRVRDLAADVEALSTSLGAAYEEITLIYRLTQNLKLSRKQDKLADLALDWLYEILPAEAVAIQLLSRQGESAAGSPPPRASRLLLRGECGIDNALFSELVELLSPPLAGRAVVLNDAAAQRDDWPFAAIRDVVLVSLSDGEHHSGWLAAFNHRQRTGFGTIEAGCLSSASAVLGIHGGNRELYHQQADLLTGVVRALSSAIDAKDPYTCGHSDRVARVSACLARALGLNDEEVETVHLSGLLHDVGKIGIDDSVLRKPGRLTAEEFEHIKTHARIGYNILKDIKHLSRVTPAVLHHHESWDGRGYPDGLAGENIPYLARIVAVADAFDAMSSDRPYRKGMPDDKLDEVLLQGAGEQWDAKVVEAFFRVREEVRAIAASRGQG